ncbi:MAG: regulatory protein GemA [Pseudomonadota bacterium]
MTDQLRRKIFAGCKVLGLDQDARRDLQLRVVGKASLSDMDEADMLAVVKELRAKGFTAAKGKKHPKAKRPDVRKIHVMWGLLGKAGKLRVPSREGLNAFIRSRFEKKWGSVPMDVDTMTEASEISDVIEALKDWCDREGVEYQR